MSNSYREDAVKRGSEMRDKAMAMAMKRKEEYLGARVPKALKERVINKADEMGIPVSLLMRRLLEQTFPENGSGSMDLGESGSSNTFAVNEVGVSSTVSQVDAKTGSQGADKYASIIGWKSIEVNQDRSCERCKEPLPRGDEALLGFNSSAAGFVIVCQQCKTQLSES